MSETTENQAAASAARADAARHRLLDGPLASTILRIAAPTVAVLAIQIVFGMVELYFVSGLGTEVLAGATMVFPLIMLTQMMSNGGIGAGVSSAVARAIGAGRREDASALVVNAIAIALAMGALFTAADLLGGRALFKAMGGDGPALAAAEIMSTMIFSGAALVWLFNLLAAALRGCGETRVPARISIGTMLVTTPLSPLLIFGWGPFPRLGILGAGAAFLVYYGIACVLAVRFLRSSKSPLRLRFDWRLVQGRLLADILKVGAIAAVGALVPNLAAVIVTATVGRFGPAALAGWGLAARLDQIIIPLLFGIGTAILAVVGAATGARRYDRAYRAAWIGSAIGAGVTAAMGLAAALLPEYWLRIFTDDPTAIATGVQYLHLTGPSWGLTGLSMLLGMAAQGSGHALWPLIASLLRLCVGAIGGMVLVTMFGSGQSAIYVMIVAGALTSCATMTIVQLRTRRR